MVVTYKKKKLFSVEGMSPIVSAPKDKPILVVDNDGDFVVASWNQDYPHHNEGVWKYGECSCDCEDNDGIDEALICYPVAWMALPEIIKETK